MVNHYQCTINIDRIPLEMTSLVWCQTFISLTMPRKAYHTIQDFLGRNTMHYYFDTTSMWPMNLIDWVANYSDLHLIIHYFISRVIMGAMAFQITSRFFNHLFGRRWKKTSKLRVTGLYEGNSPVTDEFPAQRVSNAENVSIWWRHHIRSVMKWTWEQKRIVLQENAALPGIHSQTLHSFIIA